MFSKELKLAAIKDYYNGLGFTKVTKKYGIKGYVTLYEWIRKVEQFGIKYFSKNTKTYKKRNEHSIICIIRYCEMSSSSYYDACQREYEVDDQEVIS